MMRDPDSWKDPDEFILKYLRFGAGRRGCPGSNLGNTFVGTAVGVMVQCFDWRIDGEKVNMEEALGELSWLWLILLNALLFLES